MTNKRLLYTDVLEEVRKPPSVHKYKREKPTDWLRVLDEEGLLEEEEDATLPDMDESGR